MRFRRHRPFERSWQWSSFELSLLTDPRRARATVSYSLGLYPIYYACSASALPSMTLVALHIRPRRTTRLRNRVCAIVHDHAEIDVTKLSPCDFNKLLALQKLPIHIIHTCPLLYHSSSLLGYATYSALSLSLLD